MSMVIADFSFMLSPTTNVYSKLLGKAADEYAGNNIFDVSLINALVALTARDSRLGRVVPMTRLFALFHDSERALEDQIFTLTHCR